MSLRNAPRVGNLRMLVIDDPVAWQEYTSLFGGVTHRVDELAERARTAAVSFREGVTAYVEDPESIAWSEVARRQSVFLALELALLESGGRR
jgi:hypothetical protein